MSKHNDKKSALPSWRQKQKEESKQDRAEERKKKDVAAAAQETAVGWRDKGHIGIVVVHIDACVACQQLVSVGQAIRDDAGGRSRQERIGCCTKCRRYAVADLQAIIKLGVARGGAKRPGIAVGAAGASARLGGRRAVALHLSPLDAD